ncbi:MAG: hypothetical protein KatS3mg102_2814 [Planctomycetota bacterium]|nr:MAG: hypothetical protein KatS3mg102_2814 [Planctomycetota bacterium]
MVYLHWERAVLVDPLGGQHAVAAFRGEPSTELLDGAGQPLGLGPGQTWHGTVHARDRLGRRSRGQLLLRPLLSGEQARPGGKLRLVLPVDIGVRPAVYEFTLAVHEPAP